MDTHHTMLRARFAGLHLRYRLRKTIAWRWPPTWIRYIIQITVRV